ncbi:hypothetical protein ACJMK2_023809 [Sinanodonta woodiana]|uniref:Uncharacterized protein n=1 Tax=Sinanodonta woodiana TaxID=1069815 RepID=A0ABD3T6P9_SINWO
MFVFDSGIIKDPVSTCTLHMDSPHIKILLLVILIVSATHVSPLELQHSNKNSREFLPQTRSAPSKRSFDQTRASSVANCNEPTCVANEQLCNETRQGCEMCRYGHDECTANWDCFQFCAEKKAKEICGGLEGSIETTGFPWWSYLILVIFTISVAINLYFVILKVISKNKPITSRPALPMEPMEPSAPLLEVPEVKTNQKQDVEKSEGKKTINKSDSATSDADKVHVKKPDTETIDIGGTVPIKDNKITEDGKTN